MDIILFIITVYIIRSIIRSKKRKNEMNKDIHQKKLNYWDQVKKELNIEKKAMEFEQILNHKTDTNKKTNNNSTNKKTRKFDEVIDRPVDKPVQITSSATEKTVITNTVNGVKVEYLSDLNKDLKKAIIMKEIIDAPKALQ